MRALILVAAVSLVAGCLSERPYAAPTRPAMPGAETPVNGDGGGQLTVSNARVRGDIGAVRAFDADADQIDAWYDDTWHSTSITLTANDPQGRMGMVILDVDGVDLRAVPAGSYAFSTQSVDPALENGYVSVTGCSSDPSSYYDEQGNDGTVTISDEPSGRKVDVDVNLPVVDDNGSYTEARTTATGSFSLQ